MLTHLPKSHRHARRSEKEMSAQSHFTGNRFHLTRRRMRRLFWKNNSALFLIVALWFACEIGKSLMVLADRRQFSGLKLELYHRAHSSEHIPRDKALPIWLSQRGRLLVGDRLVNSRSDLGTIIADVRHRTGRDLPVLIVDRNAYLKSVFRLVTQLKELGYREIIFQTNTVWSYNPDAPPSEFPPIESVEMLPGPTNTLFKK